MRRLATLLTVLFVPSVASASPAFAVHVEGAAAHAVGPEKSDQFGWGGTGVVTPEIVLNKILGLEVSLGALGLSAGDGKTPPGVVPTTWGFAAFSTVGPRIRPLATVATPDGPFQADGLWVAGGAGAGVTSDQVRPTISASLGYDVQAAPLAAGPFVGFFDMVETHNGIRPDDARVLMFGVHGSLSTAKKRKAPQQAAPPKPLEVMSPDQDGPPDAVDSCPVEASSSPNPDCSGIKVIGDDIVLDDRIHFETGLAVVKRVSWPLLQHVAAFMNAHPELSVIHVDGHTDDTGPLPFNDRLSKARAEAVKALLAQFGVAPGRLTVESYGPRRPRAEGISVEARRENRRVEFEIVERAHVEPAPDAEDPR